LAHVLGEVALVEGKPASASEQFGQALEHLAEIEAPFERALTQARAGTALIAAGERELGVERLTSAYRTFRKLGARPFANRIAADLEAAGEQVDKRLGRRAARELEHGGLTRRELEILRLVAVGRTNREIAHQLFLSRRTVDMHVRNMLAKLGCRSRTAATTKAHELGLLEPVSSKP
jgi:DNA-binding NarL/FixJ family response regulator